MDLELVTSPQQFLALRDDWNRLANHAPLRSWEWHAAWWEAFGDQHQLAVLVVRHAGQTVGIAPWCLSEHPLAGRALRFLGSGKACTDYQRILVQPEHQMAVVEVIGLALVDSSHRIPELATLDCFEFDGVTGDETSIRQILQILSEHDFEIHAREIDSSWVVQLPDQWETFEASLPKQLRRKVKKALTRAESPEISFHTTHTVAEFDRIWPTFVRLHQQRFQNRAADPGCFVDASFEKFLAQATRQLLQLGQAEISWVQHHDEPFAAQLYLLNGATACMYQSGFDPTHSDWEPGHLLYTYVFRQFIARRFAHLDFLRGNEPYKAMWNAQPVPLHRYRCVPPRLMPRLRQEALNVGRTLKQLAGNYF